MSKPNIPNQRSNNIALKKRLNKYELLVQSAFDALAKEAASIAIRTDYDSDDGKPFTFSHYPSTKQAVEELQRKYVVDMGTIIMRGTSAEWKNSNLAQDALVDGLLKSYNAERNGEKYEHYYQMNSPQLKAFQQRKDKGMNLSDNLWDKSNDMKEEMEQAISAGIEKGMSAVTLSKRLSKYLNNFDELKDDYKERFGTATSCKNCEYASIRLAKSEINMAYRKAEHLRWNQMDFVVGKRIKTTQNGKHKEDMCDLLAGDYPKDFDWVGWHPNCYSDDSKVLTNHGWKLFADVENSDLIFSLNPETRNVEYVPFVMKQCYEKHGQMIHFYNRNLDCLVTPEHQMVYLNKNNGEIRRCTAEEYRKGKGGFYRSSEYESEDIESITIGSETFPFDWFCEFMGYWLSDGSTIRKSQVIITQQDGQGCCEEIESLLSKQGFEYHKDKLGYSFYCTDLCQYLKQFGTCRDKVIPNEITKASRRQIEIFLSAFVKCDGCTKKPHSFVGSHGNLFVPKEEKRQFFTTSETMAGQLSELLVKIGHRPSIIERQPSITIKKDGSIVKGNYICYVINDCSSSTATVFDKEYVDYDGYVYDLTLERNHIMYISRNGRCYWGSNCMCYCIPILKTEDEFWAEDSENSTESVNEIKELPSNFTQWMEDNKKRIDEARDNGKLPYFLNDNYSMVFPKKKTPIEIAEERHSARTEEDIEKIRDAWKQSRAHNFAINNGLQEGSYDYDDLVSFFKEHFDDELQDKMFAYTVESGKRDDYDVVGRILYKNVRKDIPKYIDSIFEGSVIDEDIKDEFRQCIRGALRDLKIHRNVLHSIAELDNSALDIEYGTLDQFKKLYDAYRRDLGYYGAKKQIPKEIIEKYSKEEATESYLKAKTAIKKIGDKGLDSYEKILQYNVACGVAKNEVSQYLYEQQRLKAYNSAYTELSASNLTTISPKFADLIREIRDDIDLDDFEIALGKIEKARNLTIVEKEYSDIKSEVAKLSKNATPSEKTEFDKLLKDVEDNLYECKEADSVISLEDLMDEVSNFKLLHQQEGTIDGTRIVSSKLSNKNEAFAEEVRLFDGEFKDLAISQRESATDEMKTGITEYTGGSYVNMNRGILGLDNNISDSVKQLINGCTDYLERCEFGKELVVRRGTTCSIFESMFGSDITFLDENSLKNVIGLESKPQCFLSCGATQHAGFTDTVEFYIKLNKDTKAAYVDRFSWHSTIGGLRKDVDFDEIKMGFTESEFEVVIQQGYKFKITKVGYNDPTKRGKYWFELEIVGREEPVKF